MGGTSAVEIKIRENIVLLASETFLLRQLAFVVTFLYSGRNGRTSLDRENARHDLKVKIVIKIYI